jgi:hypothetical protein
MKLISNNLEEEEEGLFLLATLKVSAEFFLKLHLLFSVERARERERAEADFNRKLKAEAVCSFLLISGGISNSFSFPFAMIKLGI